MNQAAASAEARPAASCGCLCCEIQRLVEHMFRLPEPTRQHLRNSRIEFLKAIRSLVDERIAQLSRVEIKGTKVPVE
ncbi:MAG: hypothetical protein RMI94_07190 [Bryobacterales bacterium]|nr:hypothetical protein [Bryobacteraceae bacterium]MDW8130317.1 hypothetical protein [Bryobacterales bacterium]